MRNLFALILLFVLTSCGFQPMYAPTRTSGEIKQIYVTPIAERTGQVLRNALLDKGFSSNETPGGPVLSIVVYESTSNLGVAPDSTATRNQLTLTATTVLTKGDKEIMRRILVARANYNVLLSQYTTLVSTSAARDEALHDLARQIETQTILSLNAATP